MIFRAIIITVFSIGALTGASFASPAVSVSVTKPVLKTKANQNKKTKIVHPLLVRVKDARKKVKQRPKALKGFDLSGAMRAAR